MAKDAMRFGIVGLGRAGYSMHVAVLREQADARIIAVVDPELERREQVAAELKCNAYSTLQQLLKDPDVDVVVLATPSVGHHRETLSALSVGKHVVVEKPMAMNVTEADEMISAAKAADKELFIHHNLRFTREFTHLEDVIRSGKIGKLFHMRVNSAIYLRRNDWQTLRKNGGGILNNAGSHFLDLTLALLPSPVKSVWGDARQICSAGDAEDHVKIMLRCEDGCTADLEITTAEAIEPPLPKWILCGTHGTLTSDGKMSSIRWYEPKDAPALKLCDGPAADRRYGNDEVLPWQHEIVPSLGRDVGTFYDNVFSVIQHTEGKRVTPESVSEVIRVIGEVRLSAGMAG